MSGNADVWLPAVAAVGSLIFAILVALLTLLVRVTRRATMIESDVKSNTRAINAHLDDTRNVHAAMLETMREDRKAANERLAFLERQRMTR